MRPTQKSACAIPLGYEMPRHINLINVKKVTAIMPVLNPPITLANTRHALSTLTVRPTLLTIGQGFVLEFPSPLFVAMLIRQVR
jgi:hypothetical protein